MCNIGSESAAREELKAKRGDESRELFFAIYTDELDIRKPISTRKS